MTNDPTFLGIMFPCFKGCQLRGSTFLSGRAGRGSSMGEGEKEKEISDEGSRERGARRIEI